MLNMLTAAPGTPGPQHLRPHQGPSGLITGRYDYPREVSLRTGLFCAGIRNAACVSDSALHDIRQFLAARRCLGMPGGIPHLTRRACPIFIPNGPDHLVELADARKPELEHHLYDDLLPGSVQPGEPWKLL